MGMMQQENILGTDAFVAVTGRDEDNLLMALYARRSGVGKVVAKMNRPNYSELVKDIGLDSVVSPKDITANTITRYVRALANSEGSTVESLYKMMGGYRGHPHRQQAHLRLLRRQYHRGARGPGGAGDPLSHRGGPGRYPGLRIEA